MRPRPALQCTASAPGSSSTMLRNLSTMSEEGQEPSGKNSSWCLKPPAVKDSGLYSYSAQHTACVGIRDLGLQALSPEVSMAV